MTELEQTFGYEAYCPACGNASLTPARQVVGTQIVCTTEGCPDPLAVMKILADPETEHVAILDETGYAHVKHPLKERIDDTLLTCRILKDFDLDVLERLRSSPGRYRVTRDPAGDLHLEALA